MRARVAECPEAEPDCELDDWSVPIEFCLNDCDAEYKYCFELVARFDFLNPAM